MGSGDGHRVQIRQAARAFSVAIAAVVGLLCLPLGIATGAPAPSGTSDLSLTKSDSPDPVFAGAPLAYSIRVSNAGPDAATNTVVTDNLPKDTGFVSAQAAQGSCSVSGNHRKVTCKLGTLAPVSGPQYGPQYNPAPATITINVLAPSKVGKKGSTITNTASVSSDMKDPKAANNKATATTRVVPPPVVSCQGTPATVVGTAGDDLLMGTVGNDVIFAGAGNDRIFSLGGTDLICAGAGNDVVGAGAGADHVSAGPGADRVFGRAGADLLRGGRGRDLIRGGRGPDLLAGGLGRDHCFGGPGRDRFRSC